MKPLALAIFHASRVENPPNAQVAHCALELSALLLPRAVQAEFSSASRMHRVQEPAVVSPSPPFQGGEGQGEAGSFAIFSPTVQRKPPFSPHMAWYLEPPRVGRARRSVFRVPHSALL